MKRIDDGRSVDLAQARSFLKSSDPAVRKAAYKTVENLRRGESKEIRSMRQSLVKAHREGNTEAVKDIHDFIKNKPKYHNE